MLKKLPTQLATGLHGSIPPHRYWAYYTWQEIDAIAKRDRNATAVLNVGAVEQHGPHLPLITDTLLGMEVLGAALARLPEDVTVLALPPTMFGKSVEHITFPGTLTFTGDTLRLVLRDLAASVARSGFTKLVLLGSHGGNVGTTDDYFRDLRMETDLRVFKIFLGGIGNVPGLVAPDEAAIAMHSGDSETSLVRHIAPDLVHMDRAEGYVFEPTPEIGYSFKGHDVIEAWVASDLSKTGAIGNPHRSSAEKGRQMFEAKASRLAELLQAIYRSSKREIHLAPKDA
jgi:creatinine amidohydrolase